MHSFGSFLKPRFDPEHPHFPPLTQCDADGMILRGGCLSTAWLIEAYQRGIFPWPIPDDLGRNLLALSSASALAWFSPDPRAIIELLEFHMPARLARRMRRGEFSCTIDKRFADVMRSCSMRPKHLGTWITSDMCTAYQRLHELKIAHSVEVWQRDELVGGIYGVALGGCFSAESMFHCRTDASKAALYFLVQHLQNAGFTLLDVQLWSPHLAQFGAKNISRTEFLRRLEGALKEPTSF
jgi:leucyl/phenylalanyl-tRNA--protein transferase